MGKRASSFVVAFVLGWLMAIASAASAQSSREPSLQVAELYSNGDGSVQYVVLVIVRNDVPLAGQSLVVDNGVGGLRSFAFARDVADGSLGRFVLIGTQGFADLGLVEPDFVIPNGFLFLPRGRIRIGHDSGVAPYWWVGWDPARTSDEYLARFDLGCLEEYGFACGAGVGNPRNNAGQSARLALPGWESHTGLYWAAPAGSEPGWAVAVENHGAVVLAAWVTHDTDGLPVWFVMPRAEMVVDANYGLDERRYVGRIYRMSGPALGSLAFDPSEVRATEVGYGGIYFPTHWENEFTGDLEYVDGTFWYQLTGAAPVVRRIAQQVFSDRIPVCVKGGNPGTAANYQGLWWNVTEPGWGLHLTHQGDLVFAIWLTYDRTARATWLTMTAKRSADGVYGGTIYRTIGMPYGATFDPSTVRSAPVGSGSLEFSDRDHGIFSSTVEGLVQAKPIARQVFANPASVCN